MKKILFLFLALLLPIAVFLFLKGFGKNEFNVEPLYQSGVDHPTNCSNRYKFPYIVEDSVLATIGWKNSDSLTLIVFNQANDKKIITQENRLETELRGFVKFSPKMDIANKECIFLLQPGHNAVLIDSKKRIRGQYDLTDLDEADRLIMESKIILKKY